MTSHGIVLAAYALASSGHPDEARELLRANPESLGTVDGLDLIARLELKAGREDEARRLWTRAIEMGAESHACRAALETLDSFEWRHRRAILVLRFAILVTLILLNVILIGLLIGH